MQLTIKNTHIFDRKIQEEFREFIKLQKDKIDTSKIYELVIIYNSHLVLDRYEDTFYFDNSIYNTIQVKFKNQNKKGEAISTQIDQCIDILKDYGIECYNSRIEGHKLNNNNIEIILEEDKSELLEAEKKMSKGKIGVTMIIPNMEYTDTKIGEFYNKRINEMYSELRRHISKDIMCKILHIKYIKDEDKIYKAFRKEYSGLWLGTEDERKQLKENLVNRVKILNNESLNKI